MFDINHHTYATSRVYKENEFLLSGKMLLTDQQLIPKAMEYKKVSKVNLVACQMSFTQSLWKKRK